jgi:glycosyltransferase involved in cell wall biosynthesis
MSGKEQLASGGANGAGPRLTVVIPAFNEEQNVAPVLDENVRVLSGEPVIGSFEIIVVNDGSRDGTGAKAEAYSLHYPNIRVLHHDRNLGIGAALKTGYAAARGEWVVATCADGEVPVSDVVELMNLTPGADLVVSTRERPPGSEKRQLFSRVYHGLTNLLVGFHLSGMEGIYIIRRDILQDIDLTANTPLLNVQIIMHCVSRGCRIATGKMHVLPRLSGQSKMATWRSILKVIIEMFKLRLMVIGSNIRRKFKASQFSSSHFMKIPK